MKLHTERNDDVEVVGCATTEFTIEWNAKMAKMLSDDLYSRKIEAVIRELSTNAADAHTVAKNNKPFDVTLPTIQHPFFTVRDYGTGLSSSQVTKIYTVYGASNKTNNNALTGCLGLGSKSPGCYNTKTATIHNYYNGKKYTYLFHKNEQNVPSLATLSIESTNESNGLEVVVPVHYKDVAQFKTDCKKVFQYFEQVPHITNDNLNIVSVHNGSTYCTSSNPTLVMGNVAYPVDLNQLKLSDIESWLKNICIFVPLGTVDINISREQIQYDQRSVENLQKLYKNLHKSECHRFWSALPKNANVYTAWKLYHKLGNLPPIKYENFNLQQETPYCGDTVRIYEDRKSKKSYYLDVHIPIIYKDVNDNVGLRVKALGLNRVCFITHKNQLPFKAEVTDFIPLSNGVVKKSSVRQPRNKTVYYAWIQTRYGFKIKKINTLPNGALVGRIKDGILYIKNKVVHVEQLIALENLLDTKIVFSTNQENTVDKTLDYKLHDMSLVEATQYLKLMTYNKKYNYGYSWLQQINDRNHPELTIAKISQKLPLSKYKYYWPVYTWLHAVSTPDFACLPSFPLISDLRYNNTDIQHIQKYIDWICNVKTE